MSKYIKPWRPLLFCSAQSSTFTARMPSGHMNAAQPRELACLPQGPQSHDEAQDLLLLQDYVCQLTHTQRTLALGCSWLPVLLAALFEGGGSPLPAGLIICAISGWFCFSSRILVISRVKAAGSSTSALASASGLSRTMAMSISPPSFWMRAGRPACICARIATALFSHRVRSHSSRALCAKVPVCGGAF